MGEATAECKLGGNSRLLGFLASMLLCGVIMIRDKPHCHSMPCSPDDPNYCAQMSHFSSCPSCFACSPFSHFSFAASVPTHKSSPSFNLNTCKLTWSAVRDPNLRLSPTLSRRQRDNLKLDHYTTCYRRGTHPRPSFQLDHLYNGSQLNCHRRPTLETNFTDNKEEFSKATLTCAPEASTPSVEDEKDDNSVTPLPENKEGASANGEKDIKCRYPKQNDFRRRLYPETETQEAAKGSMQSERHRRIGNNSDDRGRVESAEPRWDQEGPAPPGSNASAYAYFDPDYNGYVDNEKIWIFLPEKMQWYQCLTGKYYALNKVTNAYFEMFSPGESHSQSNWQMMEQETLQKISGALLKAKNVSVHDRRAILQFATQGHGICIDVIDGVPIFAPHFMAGKQLRRGSGPGARGISSPTHTCCVDWGALRSLGHKHGANASERQDSLPAYLADLHNVTLKKYLEEKIDIISGTFSDIGRKSVQEDRFVENESMGHQGLYFAIYDGHGGHRCADEAMTQLHARIAKACWERRRTRSSSSEVSYTNNTALNGLSLAASSESKVRAGLDSRNKCENFRRAARNHPPSMLSALARNSQHDDSKGAFCRCVSNASSHFNYDTPSILSSKHTLKDAITHAFAEFDEDYIRKYQQQTTESSSSLRGASLNKQTRALFRLLPPQGNDGTTVVATLFAPDHDDAKDGGEVQMVTINLGDSRAVLGTNGTFVRITRDHKPSLHSEIKRINEAGGKVVKLGGMYRVTTRTSKGKRPSVFLSVSRSLGDAWSKTDRARLRNGAKQRTSIVSNVPDIHVRRLSKEDEFLILACDGIWDVITDERASRLVRKSLASSIWPLREAGDNTDHCRLIKSSEVATKLREAAKKAARVLVHNALDSRSLDNLTAIVIILNVKAWLCRARKWNLDESL